MDKTTAKIKILQKFKARVVNDLEFVIENIPKIFPKNEADEYLKQIQFYQDKLEAGLKANGTLVLDEFSVTILQYATEIHNREVEHLLTETPDSATAKDGTKIDLGMFKLMWKGIDRSNPEHIKIQKSLIDRIVSITNIAEEYFTLIYG